MSEPVSVETLAAQWRAQAVTHRAKLHLGSTGYSVTSGFQHTPECKQNFCPHGIAWSEDCAQCDMTRIEEGE